MGCLKVTSWIVALVAILIGFLASGLGARTGLFGFLDRKEFNGRSFSKGMIPALHCDVPWGFTEADMPDLTGHVSLVTGANVGLGYWTTYHLAKAGGTVVMACRTPSKCTSAAEKLRQELGEKANVVPMELDLSSFASIRAFSKSFTEEYSSLDSLVLNAGVMTPPFMTTKEGLELQIGTNHFGHFLLTSLLLPTLEATAANKGVGTVTVVSSAAHFDSYPEGIRLSIEELNDEATYQRAKAYGQSKLANVLFAQELAERVKDKSLLVNSIHPGAVDTDLPRHLLDVMSKVVGTKLAKAMSTSLSGMILWHPRDAALTQVSTAVSPSLIASKTTGKYFHPIARETRPDVHTFNSTLQKGLWKITEDFIASH